ncbi:MAG: class I adenylate-forming enzyme family protein [Lachnospiraceae bacterium]|nr:class I adenylate-forming enzyme family protein [Lachnospiraceae bacterium]
MINGNDLWPEKYTSDMITLNYTKQYAVTTYPNLPHNLYEALVASSKKHPKKIAIIDDYNREYSYSKLLKMVDHFSSYLYYISNIQFGNHVGVMLYNSIEFCISFLAINKLGAIAVPLPSKFKENEVLSLVEKSNLQHIICDENFYNWFVPLETKEIRIIKSTNGQNGYGFSHLSASYLSPSASIGNPSDPAIIMFTSGTTSQSKGALIKNYNIMHAIVSYQRILNITSQDISIIPIPIYHITGLVALLGLFLYSGATLYLHKFFDAKRVLTYVKEKGITFIHASPTVFSLLLQESSNFPKLPKLTQFACGSSNMPVEILKKVHQWLPHLSFHTVYGLTETTSPATIFPGNACTSNYIGSSGLPIPGTQFQILDDDGNDVPNGCVGEIAIKGTIVLTQYYHSVTDSLSEDGWLKTGDLGYFNSDNYLFIVDRKKDMINRGGEKIWSFDVENELYKIPDIVEAAVVGIPDDIYGEAVGAVVKVLSGSTLTITDIQLCLKNRIAKYKIPTQLLILEEIPLTTNSKIDKSKIKLLFQTQKEVC